MPHITYRPLKQSEAQLVAKYHPMACKFARLKFASLTPPLSYVVTEDELISAAAVGLCKAAQKWEPKRGAFSTCLWWHCRAQFSQVTIAYCRRNTRRTVANICDMPAPPVQRFDGEEWSRVERFLTMLKPRESKAIRLRYWQQLSLHEIGNQIGLTKERARQVINEGLDRLRYMLGEVA